MIYKEVLVGYISIENQVITATLFHSLTLLLKWVIIANKYIEEDFL